MQKKLYIIPGGGETTNRKPYKLIAQLAERKGYQIERVNPDWKETISAQVFKINKQDTVFGFSRGAVLAYCVGKKYKAKKVILASMTPANLFSLNILKKHLGIKIARDIKKIIFTKPRKNEVYLYGEYEMLRLEKKGKMHKSIKIIKKTEHKLTPEYISAIVKEL